MSGQVVPQGKVGIHYDWKNNFTLQDTRGIRPRGELVPQAEEQNILIGKVISHYKILEELGRGAFRDLSRG